MHILIALCALALLLFALDLRLKTVYYRVETEKLEGGLRVALITDLHSCRYGKGQKNLIAAIDAAAPELILLGGDFFSDEPPGEAALELLDYVTAAYPCYYVTGNHEKGRGATALVALMKARGVTVLRGEGVRYTKDGVDLDIYGLDDPQGGKSLASQLELLEDGLDESRFSLLLSHRPEAVELYNRYGFDLILTGHAHGGQVRLPGLINGVYAPNQGWFPRYAGGLYKLERGTMIVSRGLGKFVPLFPRVFNRPELVIVDIAGK